MVKRARNEEVWDACLVGGPYDGATDLRIVLDEELPELPETVWAFTCREGAYCGYGRRAHRAHTWLHPNREETAPDAIRYELHEQHGDEVGPPVHLVRGGTAIYAHGDMDALSRQVTAAGIPARVA